MLEYGCIDKKWSLTQTTEEWRVSGQLKGEIKEKNDEQLIQTQKQWNIDCQKDTKHFSF